MKKLNFSAKSVALMLAFFVLVIVGAIGFRIAIAAWTGPTATPPGNNVAAPINAGATAQTKTGSLTIQQGSSFYVSTNGRFYDDGTYMRYEGPHSFYITGSSSNVYIYPGNIYLGPSGGSNVYFRGSTLTGNEWSLNAGGDLDVDCITLGTSGQKCSWADVGGGDITGVIAGTGLLGGGLSGDVTVSADTTYLQRRVSGTCAVGSSIRVVNVDGTVSCETDDLGSPVDASYVVLGLNGTLTSERVLTAGTGISITDGGVNGNVTITNTGDISITNEIQNIITNKGLQRDASNNFGIQNCTTDQIMKYDASGQWVCAADAGGVTGSGTTNYVSKWTSATALGNSQVFDNGTNVGIGTASPGYKLDVVSGGATTARFGTGSGDTVVIGGGLGKLTVNIIDPVYNISGEKFATYAAAMTGLKEETTGKIKLSCWLGGCSSVIDFKKQEKGSDLWLFYQITDFGKDWDNLVVLLTPEGNNNLWYKFRPEKGQLLIYGDRETKVSYRLTAPRFDAEEWSNINTDEGVEGINVDPKK